jgi:thiol-disulfide isomerase/thioredoxin
MKGSARILAMMLMLVCSGAGKAAAEPPRVFDSTSWQALLNAHKGQPVIVHFWGFTCGNCMVELDAWGRFAEKHRGAKIAFVNWDRRGADPARIDRALAKSGMGEIESYVLANGFEEKLRFAVDHDWMGELPYTRLISGDGSVTTFSGAADFEQLSKWLEPGNQSRRIRAGAKPSPHAH